MEIAIAIFVGIWIAAAGVLSFVRIKKDYFDTTNPSDLEPKGDDRP